MFNLFYLLTCLVSFRSASPPAPPKSQMKVTSALPSAELVPHKHGWLGNPKWCLTCGPLYRKFGQHAFFVFSAGPFTIIIHRQKKNDLLLIATMWELSKMMDPKKCPFRDPFMAILFGKRCILGTYAARAQSHCWTPHSFEAQAFRTLTKVGLIKCISLIKMSTWSYDKIDRWNQMELVRILKILLTFEVLRQASAFGETLSLWSRSQIPINQIRG